MKIKKTNWAVPSNSRPNRPNNISPASAILCTWGYRSLNWPRTYPVYVATKPRPMMSITALFSIAKQNA